MHTTKQDLSTVGESISHELGARMVKDFQDQHPAEPVGHFIGRGIIERILAQPGCVGIRFYNAINEASNKTLVYVGIDEGGKIIELYTCADATGVLQYEDAIVADRAGPPDPEDSWSWV